jgi:multimeric flavodoxin WrbA
MKAIILNGSHENDATGDRLQAALLSRLQELGWESEHILLREKNIGNCAGDFYCWVRSPGMCNVNDDNREIAADIARSDLMIYMTPVTFGGYSSELKRMVDHQIQNISPFFANIDGETHHQPRYARYPNFLAVGWLEEPDQRAEAIFRNLIQRNALNLYAEKAYCGIALSTQSDAELLSQAGDWLEALERGQPPRPAELAEIDMLPAETSSEPRRAILLVGSPRTRKSTSYAIGTYLMEQLAARGVETETIQVYTSLNNAERMQTLLEKLEAADLTVLAFPLYVDSLPAPVITLLERIATRRAGRPTPMRFAALANCGFPEAQHNSIALSICSEFARQSGMGWAGGIALGAGQGLVNGTPLNELDGRVMPLKNALILAAEALVQGQPIPATAQGLVAKPFIPAWLYRFMGSYGWKLQARRWGAEKALRRKTYQP